MSPRRAVVQAVPVGLVAVLLAAAPGAPQWPPFHPEGLEGGPARGPLQRPAWGLTASIPASDNVQVLGNLPECGGAQCADVWGHGDLAIVAFRGGGWGLVDTSNPLHPALVSSLSLTFTQDPKIEGSIAAVTNEDLDLPVGALLYDISDPFAPQELSRITHPRATSVHNLYLHQGFLYLSSNTTGAVEIFDVRDPRDPVHVATVARPGGRIHDAIVEGGRLYSSFLGGGFTVHDVADPRAPLPRVAHGYPGAFTHNAWPSADGRYLFTTDEVAGGHMRVWDLGEAAGGVGPVRQVGFYQARPTAIIHNVHTLGNLVYAAYYTAGLRIVDVTEPRLPVEVAYAETSSQSGEIFAGAWGVFPYTGSDLVYVSDMQTGLWVVRFDGRVAPPPTGLVVEVEQDRGVLVERAVYRLRWDPHPQATGYFVYRAEAGAMLARVTELPLTDTSFVESGPGQEGGREYSVTAVLPDGTESRPAPILRVGGSL